MRYQSAIRTDRPETLDNLQIGQWVDYEGILGRWVGRRAGVVWIAWAGSARERFPRFVQAYKAAQGMGDRAERAILANI